MNERFLFSRSCAMGLLAVLTAALLVSCSDTRQTDPDLDNAVMRKPTDDPSERKIADRGTPDALIEYVEHAYRSEYAPLYGDGLHRLFLFVFTHDVADSMGLPPDEPWWGKTNELASAAKMFNSSEVSRVEFSLTRMGAWFPYADIRGGSPPDTLYGQFARFVPDIRVTIEAPGEEPITLLVDNTFIDIMVVPDPESRGLWTVARMEEIYRTPATPRISGSRGVMVASITWGHIKALFE
jgi:hypothetical protein